MSKIEILSPGGDRKSIYAAFEAGSDAVYFGVSEFNARKRAENIQISDLYDIVAEAYLRGVKLYLTLNTLISSDEIPAVLDLIDSAMTAGIKCFIIQDYGILNILEKFYPEAEIHISTQVTTHLKGQIDFLSRTSASRINLARELSVDQVCEYTDFAHDKGMETEVFVHGSYCLSYSGQCYISSYLEGLSGNRGLCAQLCRRLYRRKGEKGYFLNLKDNCALPEVTRLKECGIDSFKIEGRIKGAEYVYTAVKTWNDIISENGKKSLSYYKSRLSSVFNRGFTAGYLENSISQMFSDSPFDASWINAGKVLSYSADKKILETENPLTDTICFSGDESADIPGELSDSYPFTVMLKRINKKNNEQQYICSGMIVSEIYPGKYLFEIEGRLNGRIEKGNSVWMRPVSCIQDPGKKETDKPVFHKVPAAVKVCCREGERFKLTLEYGGKSVSAYSDNILERGRSSVSTKADLENQLSRFGSSPINPESVEFTEFNEGLFIPASAVNKTRRKAVSLFLDTINKGRKDEVLEYLNFNGAGKTLPETVPDSIKTAFIADTPELSDFLKEKGAGEVFYDFSSFENIPDYDVIPVFHSIMTSEYAEKIAEIIGKRYFKRIVLNNTALIGAAEKSDCEWIAGNSLNILNHSASDFFSSFRGFSGFIISPEAGREEIMSLQKKTDQKIYLPFYFRAELMTTRQCLLGMRCGKTRCDENCFSRCCGTDELIDVKGKKIIIEKRVECFTALYDEKYHFVKKAVSDFTGKDLTFVIDLRIFPDMLSFSSKDRKNEIDKKKMLFQNLDFYIKNGGKSISPEIRSLTKNTSEGNYSRGLL